MSLRKQDGPIQLVKVSRRVLAGRVMPGLPFNDGMPWPVASLPNQGGGSYIIAG